MHHFNYKNGKLFAEKVSVEEIVKTAGTPCYIYSRATLTQHFHALDNAFHGVDHLICYSVKANSNLAVLRLFADYGGGADVVSGGELYRALKAGIPGNKICFSGIGKTESEMIQALEADILMFNVESESELEKLNQVSGSIGKKAPVAIRVNPDVDPLTHPYIATGLKESKFGLDVEKSFSTYLKARDMDNIEIKGIDCHIGSQVTELDPFSEALDRLHILITRLEKEGIILEYLDLGGGLGIPYSGEQPPQPLEYAAALGHKLIELGLKVILEPGRVLVGNAGILVSRILYNKKTELKNFVIVDAAMNDLIRPSLYGAYHEILPVVEIDGDTSKVDIVGPICESTDFLARDREIKRLEEGSLIAAMSTGAYSYSMTSNYNSRRRAAEVMVDGDKFSIIRTRDTFEDLIKGESIPDFLKREQ